MIFSTKQLQNDKQSAFGYLHAETNGKQVKKQKQNVSTILKSPLRERFSSVEFRLLYD